MHCRSGPSSQSALPVDDQFDRASGDGPLTARSRLLLPADCKFALLNGVWFAGTGNGEMRNVCLLSTTYLYGKRRGPLLLLSDLQLPRLFQTCIDLGSPVRTEKKEQQGHWSEGMEKWALSKDAMDGMLYLDVVVLAVILSLGRIHCCFDCFSFFLLSQR